MTDYTSPDVRNYTIFKGNVFFTPTGGARRHLGNCTQFSFEPAVDTLDHFTAMQGIKKKDFSATLSQTATLSLTLEEMTKLNLQMALFGGDIAADPLTSTEYHNKLGFDIFAVSEVTGMVELEGSNDVGPKYNIKLPSVTFKPNGAIEFIGDADWANVQLQGDVLAVGDSFGRIDNAELPATTTGT